MPIPAGVEMCFCLGCHWLGLPVPYPTQSPSIAHYNVFLSTLQPEEGGAFEFVGVVRVVIFWRVRSTKLGFQAAAAAAAHAGVASSGGQGK